MLFVRQLLLDDNDAIRKVLDRKKYSCQSRIYPAKRRFLRRLLFKDFIELVVGRTVSFDHTLIVSAYPDHVKGKNNEFRAPGQSARSDVALGYERGMTNAWKIFQAFTLSR